jgi:hypothetical protein
MVPRCKLEKRFVKLYLHRKTEHMNERAHCRQSACGAATLYLGKQDGKSVGNLREQAAPRVEQVG